MSKKTKATKPEDPSLRDYFAGLALQALIYAEETSVAEETLRLSAPSYARRAYILADAMLHAREPIAIDPSAVE